MRHIGKVSKPAVAREIEDFTLFGLGPAFWSSVLPGGPFQELGDLVGKWSEKIASVGQQEPV
jgi:hypothetical protein